MKPLPARAVIEAGVEVDDGGDVGAELVVGVEVVVDVELPVVPPQATSSVAQSRLHKASGVQREMFFKRMSMIHFLLVIYIFASAPLLLLMESRWITCIDALFNYTYLAMKLHP